MSDVAFIEGERVSLRPLEETDVDFRHRWENSAHVRAAMRGHGPKPRHALERVDGDAFEFVVVGEGRRVGYVAVHSIDTYDGHGTISYWIARPYQDRGYATEAVSLVVEYAFTDLRLHRVRADVRDFNTASQRVLERIGFEREGCLRESRFVDGTYCDRYCYGLLASEWGRDLS
ncbi:GNAT family N-acetyltransferase [Natronobiforma cellulositropha]|uniref:GNAT family N-acetyltransferase n=1 Tax=Natronobiforma cellulositropha TaxID=1679076 RepID=UPI0021D61308|nr:GNAT family protein [Natronobiforma cellulositropha]